MGCPLGFTPEAALEGLGLPLWGPGVEVGLLLGLQGFWQHQVLRGVAGQGSRKCRALEWYGDLHWPIRFSALAWRTPPWQRSLAGHCLQGCKESDATEATLCTKTQGFFACGSSAPVRVEREGGIAAWLLGTLVAPSVQGHRLPVPQELWPYQSLSSSLL